MDQKHFKILVVDDEETIILVFQNFLQAKGYHVMAFNNSLQALDYFQNKSDTVDLVITYVFMPDMDGWTLASEICSIREDVPIIMITGSYDLYQQSVLNTKPIRAVIYKPFCLKSIIGTMNDILQRAAERE